MDQNWQDKLEAAAREVVTWLTTHTTQFHDHLDKQGGIDEIRLHFDKAVSEPGHEHDQYLFFLVSAGDATVGAGFFETNGRYVLLHSIGVRDQDRYCGISSHVLAWYLGSLSTHAIDTLVLAGVQCDNIAMRNWCARFYADEQSTPDGRAVVVHFLAADAGAELEMPPGALQPAFPRQWKGLTFRILYLGRHPRHFAPGEEPICD